MHPVSSALKFLALLPRASSFPSCLRPRWRPASPAAAPRRPRAAGPPRSPLRGAMSRAPDGPAWARPSAGSPVRLRHDAGGESGRPNGAAGDSAGSTRLLTLPTVLTLGRVAAVPLLVCTFYTNSRWSTSATTGIFLAAAITDWLDGYIARRMKLGTAFGAFLDPVADKLMVAATLVMLCTKPFEITGFGHIPWLLTVPSVAIIGREITMSAVREWAASQNSKLLEAVAVNNLGKWKTATQMVALTILLVTRDARLSSSSTLITSGVILLYISAGLAVWSLGVYMSKIWRVLLK